MSDPFGRAFQAALFQAASLGYKEPLLAAWAESVARTQVFGQDTLTEYIDGVPKVSGVTLVRTGQYTEYRRGIECPQT